MHLLWILHLIVPPVQIPSSRMRGGQRRWRWHVQCWLLVGEALDPGPVLSYWIDIDIAWCERHIPLAHHNGHQNGPQRRCIFLSSPCFSWITMLGAHACMLIMSARFVANLLACQVRVPQPHIDELSRDSSGGSISGLKLSQTTGDWFVP